MAAGEAFVISYQQDFFHVHFADLVARLEFTTAAFPMDVAFRGLASRLLQSILHKKAPTNPQGRARSTTRSRGYLLQTFHQASLLQPAVACPDPLCRPARCIAGHSRPFHRRSRTSERRGALVPEFARAHRCDRNKLDDGETASTAH